VRQWEFVDRLRAIQARRLLLIVNAYREDQHAYIGGGDLSLFTQALVEGLRGQGTGSTRGYLSAFDL
jgi:hypothetical protein